MAVKKEPEESGHEPKMLSISEAARALRSHPNTVRAWIRSGKLNAIPMGEEQVPMLMKSEVDKFKSTLQGIGVVVKEDKRAFPVVGIGASAGGLDAMTRMLSQLPTDLGLAYILVAHLEADRESTMVELLQKKTSIPVQVAENGMHMDPDRLYVIPSAMHAAVVHNTIVLQRASDVPSAVRPIDALFKALANEFQNHAIGILLSGGGTDGTEGMRAIKAEDGLTMVQDITAQDNSMPQSAREAGVVDIVLAPEAIGPQLDRVVKQLFPGGDRQLPAKHENEMRRILQHLLEKRGVDFMQYKENTIHRRIIRRMVLSKCTKLSDYARLLQEVPSELETLFSDLLINVTSFFRDPSFHKALNERIIPDLLKGRTATETIRIWVPACAGGEEVVSIAITLLQYMGANGINVPVQIFATDLNERTIEKARLGIYKKSAVQEIDPALVRQYFQHVDGHFQVIKSIRDMCVFAKHDLLKDPPFSRVDLISCQNVMIYLENAAQARVLRSFQYALRSSGFLVLGKSESTANAAELFVQRDRVHKVYGPKKKREPQRLEMDMHYKPQAVHEAQPNRAIEVQRAARSSMDIDREVERVLLNRYVPASVLVDKDLEIHRFIGPTSRFLSPRSGRASLNLLKMVRDELAFDVRSLLQKARKEKTPVRKDGITLKMDQFQHAIELEVVPVGASEDGHFLVLFRDLGRHPAEQPAADGSQPPDVRDAQLANLIRELEEAREQLRSISEDGELATQELQAANEEVVSSNEELQSINEELETSKEELQSINEEYATINEELQSRNDALAESEERLRLSTSTAQVGIWDHDLESGKVAWSEAMFAIHGVEDRSFIPTAENMAMFIHPLERDRVKKAIAHSLEHDAFVQMEYRGIRPDGKERWLYMNASVLRVKGRPVRMLGALLDITERKTVEIALRSSEKRYRELLNSLPAAVFTCDTEGQLLLYNQAAVLLWGRDPGTNGSERWNGALALFDQKGHPVTKENSPIARAVRTDDPVNEEMVVERPDGSRRNVLVYAEPMHDDEGVVVGGHGVVVDITDHQLSEHRLRVVSEAGNIGIWDWDVRSDRINWSDPVYDIHGVKKGSFELNMKGYHELIHPDDRERVGKAVQKALDQDDRYDIEFRTLNATGVVNWVYTNAVVLRDHDGPTRMIGATLNISKRKEHEEDTLRLAAIIGSSEDAIIGLDLQGTVTTWNQGASKMFGYTEDEMVDTSILVLLPAERTEEEKRLLGRIAMGERVQHFETQRKHKDGNLVHVTLSISPIKDERGRIVGASKILRDITEHKKAQEELRASQDRFRSIYEKAPFGIVLTELPIGVINAANPAFCEMIGWPMEDLIGKTSVEVGFHPNMEVRARIMEKIIGGGARDMEIELQHRSGRKVVVRTNADKVMLGDRPHILAVFEDITERMKVEQAIAESEERFHLLADNIGQLAWIAESNGEINWYNKRWFDYSGTTLEDMRGWGWQKIHHPDHVERVTAKFTEHIKNGSDWEDTFPLRGADGEYRWFLSRAFPVRDRTGKVLRWFGTNTDITERQTAEHALAESARNKDHFLATLAHELRGPLAPLKNGLQLLEMATDDHALQENLRDMMVRQLDHMVRLIDDLMDLSRINQGKVELVKQEVDLQVILSTAIETSRPLIDANEHQLEIHSTGSEVKVHGDAARLIQIVANLLSNSAKYTPRSGRIELSVRTHAKEVEIEVKDNGIGIDPTDLPKVFEMFTQVGPSEWTASGGGLGIGLNIVSRLVEMHGGSIEAKSEGSGRGSTFLVRLPILITERPSTMVASPKKEQKAYPRRIMIVDDNQDATFSMSMILKRLGHHVAVANDGLEALSVGADHRPEVVLMDIGMPKMNGYDACSAMRRTEWGSGIHIVALSGWGQEDDRQRSSDAGFDKHVVKPIERATLERIIEEVG